MKLVSLTDPELIFPRLECSDRASLLSTLAEKLAKASHVADAGELYTRLHEREELGSTAVGSGVAIPHCKMGGLDRVVMVLGLTRKGIDFDAVDREPVRLFFLVVSPSHSPAAHLQCLAAISKWVKHENHVQKLLELADADADADAIYRLLEEED